MGVVEKIALDARITAARPGHRADEPRSRTAADRQGAVLGGPAALLRRRRSAACRRLFSGSYIDLLPVPPGGAAKAQISSAWKIRRCCNRTCRAAPSCCRPTASVRSTSARRSCSATWKSGEVLGWDVGDMARRHHHPCLRAGAVRQIRARQFALLERLRRDCPARRQRPAVSGRIAARGGAGRHRVRNARGSASHRGEPGRPRCSRYFRRKDAADASTFKRSVPFIANFTSSVAGLAAGSPVTLHGIKIGEVSSVSLVYDRTLG